MNFAGFKVKSNILGHDNAKDVLSFLLTQSDISYGRMDSYHAVISRESTRLTNLHIHLRVKCVVESRTTGLETCYGR